jgi:hypothetical protein
LAGATLADLVSRWHRRLAKLNRASCDGVPLIVT